MKHPVGLRRAASLTAALALVFSGGVSQAFGGTNDPVPPPIMVGMTVSAARVSQVAQSKTVDLATVGGLSSYPNTPPNCTGAWAIGGAPFPSGAGNPTPGYNEVDWLTVSPTSGSGQPVNVTFTFTANSTGSSRYAYFDFICNGVRTAAATPWIMFTVSQDPVPTLSVTPDVSTVPAAGGPVTLNVTASTSWSVSGLPDWLTQANASATAPTYTAAANTGPARSATITFTTKSTSGSTEGQVTQSVTVAQAAAPDAATATMTAASVTAGGTATVTGSGFLPGEDVTATMHSDPYVIGTKAADPTGNVTFTWTVPATTDPGDHTVDLVGATSGTTVTAAFAVTAAGGSADAQLTDLTIAGGSLVRPAAFDGRRTVYWVKPTDPSGGTVTLTASAPAGASLVYTLDGVAQAGNVFTLSLGAGKLMAEIGITVTAGTETKSYYLDVSTQDPTSYTVAEQYYPRLKPYNTTTEATRVLVDQFNAGENHAPNQLDFIATYLEGSQKNTSDITGPVLAQNPGWHSLHYHLAIWNNPDAGIIWNDTWTTAEWDQLQALSATDPNVFMYAVDKRTGTNSVIRDTSPSGVYLMNITNDTYYTWLLANIIDQCRTDNYDSVFLDSYDMDTVYAFTGGNYENYDGTALMTYQDPQLGGLTWAQASEEFMARLTHDLNQAGIWSLPNMGNQRTSWDPIDYAYSNGGMFEQAPDTPTVARGDWQQDMSRYIYLAEKSKVLIYQNYSVASLDDVSTRLYVTAAYQMGRADYTYVNQLIRDQGEAAWYPEYGVGEMLGRPTQTVTGVPDTFVRSTVDPLIEQYAIGNSLYERTFQYGLVVINGDAGGASHDFTVPDDGRAYLSVTIQPGSGGMVTADGIAAITGAPNYPLVQTPVSPGQVITLPGDGALILVTGGVQQPDASTSELTVGSWDVTLPCDGSLRPPGWSTSAPVDVLVLDAAGSPVPGVDVTFTVDAGGTFGNPDGPPDQRHQSIVVQSNPEGVAAATVSSGTGGEAIIRATIDTGSGPADVAGSPGKVAALADCPSTGDQTLTFASSSLTKAYGDAPFTNALTHIGAGTVTYASSDPSVATVDATTGEVTVHNLGTATITASAAMVPGVWLAAEASYDLTVVPASCGGAAGALTSSDSLVPWSGNGGYDVSHYGIDLAYTPAAGTDPYRIDATTTIDASTTSGTLCSFGLDLYGLTVSSVTVNGIRANFDRIQDASTNMYKLVVTPATPLYGDFTVAVAYSGTPQQLTFHGSGDFAVGWIPNASFTVGSTTYPADGGGVGLGEPVGAFAWYPVNATPSDKASYTTTLTVPTGWQGVAVGDLVSTTAVSPTQDTWTWDEPDAVPSSFTIAAIGRYQAYLGTHTTPGGTVVPLEIYADPILASAGLGPDHYMALTQQLLDWGEAYFGPYTPAVAGYVMKRIPISYALEVYGKPFYAGDYGDSIYVHEFAHQWGGNSVSVADWSDLWLAEGFATYVQWLWAADRGGQTVEQQALSVYNRPATDSLWTVAPAAMRNQGDMFGNWNYDGGALALAALRVGIGPDLAEQVLRDWFTTYAGGNASTQDFIDLAESVSGADLTQWADDYLYSYGKPPSWPTAQEYLPAGTPLLSFADATVTKTVGDAPFTNTLVYDGSGDLTFTSSDTTVATVGTDGLVTITGAGDTTITVDAAAVPGLWAPASASYTLTVQPAPVDPTAKRITSFTVNGVAGAIDQTNHTIIVTLPAGSDLSALAPQIAFDGASVSPASGETRDFSGIGISAVLYYTVTAEDGSTQKYDVVVGSDGPRISVMRALDGSSYNVHPGDPVTVTFVVANWGLGAADDLVVSAPLPAGLNPGDVTATATNGTYDPATGMWHIDHIDPASLVDAAGYTLTSGTRMLTLAFTVPSDAKTGDDLTFAAELTSIGGQTPPPSMVIVGSTVPIHYLVTAPGEGWLRPSVAGGTFPLGTPQLTYTLGLYNIGTGPVTGVQAVHHIPDGFTLVSAVPNLGTYDPASGVWTIDDTIDPAHTAQLVVTLTPDPDLTTGTVPVTVQVTRIDGADVPSDLSATGNLVFQEPISIVLTADADKATAGPGEQVTHTIAVTSTNTYSLWSLQVNVTLPEHATLVSSSADGSFDPATGKWVTSWVALQTGGGMTKPTLTLTYTVDSDAPDGAALTTTARIDPIPEVGVADPITASATTTVTGGITAPTDLSGATVGVMGPQVYTGMPLTPPVTVTLGGVSLVEGTDFTVAFSNNTNAGTASVTVTGIGAYAGTASGSFTIGPRVITFTIDPINDQAWTGSPVTPTIVVHDGTKLLVAGTDYTVSYETNTDAGTATVTVSGVGNYEGSGAQVTFTITAPPVEPKPQTLTFDQSSAAKIIGDAPFTNTLAHVGDGTVTFASSDETVAVVDASGLVTIVGVGEATITATAAAVPGEWLEATASYTLTVSPKDLSSATVGVQGPQVYTGVALTPPVTVTLGGVSLVEGTDFTVVFADNVNAGTASVTVTGTGNYTGTASGLFTIGPRVITFTVDPIADQAWTGSAITPASVVHEGTKLLVAGTDYTVAYANNTDVGTASMTVSGVGNYAGSTGSVSFTITRAVLPPDASKSTLTVGAWEVTLPCDGSLRPLGWSTSAPLSVVVHDAGGVPVAGVDVTFTVDAGGTFGNPNGSPGQRHQSIVVSSDVDGVAAATVSSGSGGEAVVSATIDSGSGPVEVQGSPGKVAALADCPSDGTQLLRFDQSSVARVFGDAPFTNALTHVGGGTVTFTSSAPAVATVDQSGLVRIVGVGEAMITADAAVVPGVWLEASASYTLVVSAKVITFAVDPIADQAWTGAPVTPAVVVHDGATLLVAGTDYTTSYANNTAAGTATVTVTGIGNYAGSSGSVSFRITAPVQPKAQTLRFDKNTLNVTFGDPAFTNTLTHVGGGVVSFASSDTSVAMVDQAGVVTIIGVGSTTVTASAAAVPGVWLAGSASFTVNVRARSISGASVSVPSPQTFTGAPLTPPVTVTLDGVTLVQGADFTVVYAKNTAPGTASVTVSGVGNYTGKASGSFAIVAAPPASLVVSPTSWAAPGGAASMTVTVTTDQPNWTVTSSVPWLTATRTGDTITLTTRVNNAAVARTGMVTVTAGSATATVTVTQASGNVNANKHSVGVDAKGGKQTLTIEVTPGATWKVTGLPGWCRADVLSGGASTPFTFTLDPFTGNTPAARLATLTFVLEGTDPVNPVEFQVVVHQWNWPGPAIMLAHGGITVTRVEAGWQVTAVGAGFAPGETVRGTMHSTPLDLGTQVADADGLVTFAWTVPADTALGDHTVELSANSQTVQASFTAIAATGTTPGTQPPSTTIPTGGQALPTTGAAAVLVLLAGALVVVAVYGLRRRYVRD